MDTQQHLNEKPEKVFPPVPDWQPDIPQSLDAIIERIKYYTNNQRDIAVLKHGTCVILADELSDNDAQQYAIEVLHHIYHFHPDMNPINMDDGNILVQYNHPAVNLVLEDHAQKHWTLIEQNHQRALATDEVLITPLGPNTFDDFGKKALFGRCFMFMDAQEPTVIKIVRKGI